MASSFFLEKIFTPNIRIEIPLLSEKKVELWLKREDQIHPYVSGNKFRKLKYNILEAQKQQKKTLMTFGGAFSNHILAVAAAGNAEQLKTVGVIRGDELGRHLEKTLATNPTLKKATEYKMQFEFISRENYRDKMDSNFLAELQEKYGDYYLIPEGGTNELAVKGCEEILTKDDEQFDYICSCVGTGGTISGLILSAKNHQKVLGFPALKGNFLKSEIESFVGKKHNWELITKYHFGGYGKYSEELIRFINKFKQETEITLDPIYTGKMLFGILDLIREDQIPEGSSILVIHTGGLQGIEGFNSMLEKKGSDLKIHT